MADKSTWLNGAGTIPGSRAAAPVRSVSVEPYPVDSAGDRRRRTRTIMIAGAIAICSALLLTATPANWTWELLRIMSVGIVLMAAFYFPVHYPKPAFVIWFVMLISECIFFREGDSYSNTAAYQGSFPTAAYGEVVGWMLCLLAVLVCAIRMRGFFRRLFEGDYKWPALFTIVCFGSCLYTPRLGLGLVWAVKLALVVMLLVACSIRIHDFRDTVSFLRFTVWAYVIIVMQPVVVAMMRGQMFDEEGRMSTIVSPNALSPNAAMVLLLALTLFSTRKGEGLNKSAILIGLGASLVMVLAGSKTGVLAAIFAGGIFFLIRGRWGSAVTFIAGTAVLVGALILTTPLGDYLHLYQERAGVDSLSGRTLLWNAVLPAIKAKPILGHGYMSSEFIAIQINAVGWSAPQLHNGFLEALYNTGILGLLAMMMILLVIPRNLIRVLRVAPKSDYLYQVAAGCLALYGFLIINGFFNSSFGGKCTSPFMVLLGLVIVSHKLRESASHLPTGRSAKGGLARLDTATVGV
jgi:O-antigen ligase